MSKFNTILESNNNIVNAENWSECIAAIMADENMSEFEAEIMLRYDCQDKADTIDLIQAAVTHKRLLHREYSSTYSYYKREFPQLSVVRIHEAAKSHAHEMAWHWVYGERKERHDYDDTMSLEECKSVLCDDYIGKLDKAGHDAWMAADSVA